MIIYLDWSYSIYTNFSSLFCVTTALNKYISFVELFFGGPDVPLDTNPAYVDHKSLAEQIKQHSDIAMKNNEAYMEVILDSRSGGCKDRIRVNN